MTRQVVHTAALLAAIAAAALKLHAQQPAESAAVHRLSGCYRITLGSWSGPLPATGMPAAHTPPAHFRLDTVAVQGRFASGYVVEPHALARQRRGVRPASWRPLGGDSLSVVWSTGFVGVTLRLVARGDTLVGRARTLHDAHAAGEPPDPEASVTAVRVRCEAELRGPTLRLDTSPPVRWAHRGEFPDDAFAEIADSVPGFAGILVSHDTLVLMLVDPSRRADAEAAARSLIGMRRPRYVIVRRAQYDFRQLRDWKGLARRADVAGWTMLDADEARNRIVIGVRDSSYLLPARRALEAQGIPAGAIIVEVVSPAVPMQRREPSPP